MGSLMEFLETDVGAWIGMCVGLAVVFLSAAAGIAIINVSGC